VWTHGVVILSPGFDDLPRILQTRMPALVQTFIVKLSVEAFDEGFLHRLAGIGVQVGSAGKEKAKNEWNDAEQKDLKLAGALHPDVAAKILNMNL
jgi:hypothetical protein